MYCIVVVLHQIEPQSEQRQSGVVSGVVCFITVAKRRQADAASSQPIRAWDATRIGGWRSGAIDDGLRAISDGLRTLSDSLVEFNLI